MANTIIAGNGTNNGLAVTSDGSGALNILTGSGAGTAAISIDSSQNVTAAANLSVTGNATITGTLSATNGITGSLKSATTQASTSGTSIDFTGIPSGVKRITVMFNGVSTSGASIVLIQLGSSSVETTGYLGAGVSLAAAVVTTNYTNGFGLGATGNTAAGTTRQGSVILSSLGSNIWTCFGIVADSANAASTTTAGSKTTSGVLDRIRITTVNGTDTFDAGSINIIYE